MRPLYLGAEGRRTVLRRASAWNKVGRRRGLGSSRCRVVRAGLAAAISSTSATGDPGP